MLYITLRQHTYYFSRKLPDILAGKHIILPSGSHKVGANGYLRISLRTGRKSDATKLGRRLAVEVDDALDTLLARQAQSDSPITTEEIKRSAALMKSVLLSSTRTTYTDELAAELAGQKAQHDNEDEEAQNAASDFIPALPDIGPKGDAEILRRLNAHIPFFVLQTTGKVLSGPITADYAAFATALRETYEILGKRANGIDVPTPPAPPTTSITKESAANWDEILDYYLRNTPLRPSSITKYRQAINRLASFSKCQPAELTRKKVIEWRDAMLTELASKTVEGHVINAGAIYHYATNNEKLGPDRPDPFAGISVKSSPSSRREFKLDDLKTIFNNPPSIDSIPPSAGYHAALWIPLLALFTGARRGELTGLMVDEIGERDGVSFIHIKNNVYRSLKVAHSERTIPLHHELVRLGFLDYIKAVKKAGADRVFPALQKVDKITEWFTALVKQRISIPPGIMQDIHSFRHSFKTACREAALPPDVQDALLGHRTPGVGGTYGSTASVLSLKKQIDRISFPSVVFTAPSKPTVEDIRAQLVNVAKRQAVAKAQAVTRTKNQAAKTTRAAVVKRTGTKTSS